MGSQILDNQSPLKLISKAIHLIKIWNDLQQRVFGCESYVYLLPYQTNKLSSRAIKFVIVGCSNTSKEYKCYFPSWKKNRTIPRHYIQWIEYILLAK